MRLFRTTWLVKDDRVTTDSDHWLVKDDRVTNKGLWLVKDDRVTTDTDHWLVKDYRVTNKGPWLVKDDHVNHMGLWLVKDDHETESDQWEFTFSLIFSFPAASSVAMIRSQLLGQLHSLLGSLFRLSWCVPDFVLQCWAL